jgi:hypothetical protein
MSDERLAEGRKMVDAVLAAADPVELTAQAKEQLVRELTEGYSEDGVVEAMGRLQKRIGEWRDRKKFVTTWRPMPTGNVPEKLMLIVSELSEAMEAFRHLTVPFRELLATAEPGQRIETPEGMEHQWVWYDNFCEELADTQVRLMEMCDALGIDLGAETCRKMAVNETRAIKHGKEC